MLLRIFKSIHEEIKFDVRIQSSSVCLTQLQICHYFCWVYS